MYNRLLQYIVSDEQRDRQISGTKGYHLRDSAATPSRKPYRLTSFAGSSTTTPSDPTGATAT